MSKAHLNHEEFFNKLIDIFNSRRQKDHGSVFLTQKRPVTYNPTSTTTSSPSPRPPTKHPTLNTLADLETPTNPIPILVRATNGYGKANRAKKVKISTIVQPEAMEKFFARYAEVAKAGMGALRKRDRSKRKKEKGKKRKALEKKD